MGPSTLLRGRYESSVGLRDLSAHLTNYSLNRKTAVSEEPPLGWCVHRAEPAHPASSTENALRARCHPGDGALADGRVPPRNVFSQAFDHYADPDDGSRGSKRTLSATLQELPRRVAGFDEQDFWLQLRQLVGRTVAAMCARQSDG